MGIVQRVPVHIADSSANIFNYLRTADLGIFTKLSPACQAALEKEYVFRY